MDLKQHIRQIPDFPKPGINFYDIATLLMHPQAWRACLDELTIRIQNHQPDVLVGIESRGFLMATPIADRLEIGCMMIRKAGKLPGKVLSHHYDLEYGSDTIELQPDLLAKGARVVLMDDLLATGGTIQAAAELIRKAGANPVSAQFIIELTSLKGKSKIPDLICESSISYMD